MTDLLLFVAITLLIAVLYQLKTLRGIFMPNDFTVLTAALSDLAVKASANKELALVTVQSVDVQPQINAAVQGLPPL